MRLIFPVYVDYFVGKPIGGLERGAVFDEFGLPDHSAAAHPQTQTRPVLRVRENLLVKCRIARQRRPRVRERPRIHVGGVGRGRFPSKVDKVKGDADRVADPQRFILAATVVTVGTDDFDLADLARSLSRLRHGTPQRREERGANANRFVHLHVEPPSLFVNHFSAAAAPCARPWAV